MSYSWVGAPTTFNGTNSDLGGDSSTYTFNCLRCTVMLERNRGMLQTVYSKLIRDHRHRKCEPMVPVWRPSIHHRGICYGADNGTGSWLLILWSCATKVGPEHDLGLYGIMLGHYLSVVLLGLLSGIQQLRDQRVHRRFEEIRPDEHISNS